MKLILFFHHNAYQTGVTFKEAIEKKFNKTQCQTVQTFNALKERLKQVPSFEDREIFIIIADSLERLNELASLIDLMEDKRLILILPDKSKATLSKASHFFPRFFTQISDNYDVLCSVLNKMITNKNEYK